jgi:catechol 2,3-dioxygenase-like lactoylglutathione lyase family enzyme
VSTTQDRTTDASGTASVGKFDQMLEVVNIPVSDVDRAKEFYTRLGWRLDDPPSAVVQFTPPGSSCSIQFGGQSPRTSAAPGSAQGLFLIVSDIEAARDALLAAGVEVGELFHPGPDGMLSGPDPEHRSGLTCARLSDPDGNRWILQEVTTRVPGRAITSFGSASDLADAMRRASAAHEEHEKRIGEADANWPDWYAEYMVAEQSFAELPT